MNFLYMQKTKLNDPQDIKLNKGKPLKGNALHEYKKTITLNNREGALRAGHSIRGRLHTFNERKI